MTCRREIKSTRFVSEIDGSALASPKFAVGFANATMTNSACSPTRVSAMQIRGIWCRQSKISHAKQEDPVISFNIRCQMGRQRGRLERIVDAQLPCAGVPVDPNLCGRSKLRNTASCDKKITCITRIYTLSRMLRAGPPTPIRCRGRRSICGSASTLSARRHSCMNPPESGCACAHAGMRSRRPPKPRTDSLQAVPGDVHRCHRLHGAESEQADQAGSSIVLVRVRATVDGIIELLQPARPRSVLLRQGLARGHVPHRTPS